MKNIAILLFAFWPALWMSAQPNSIPDVDLRDIDGILVSSLELTQPGMPTLMVFWESTSGKSSESMEMFREAWESVLKHHGIRMIAICIDCNGLWSHVKPLVNGNNWDFDTYIDVNGDFKRAMSVGEEPCSMLFDEDKNLICRFNSACSGSQEYICENILKHLNDEMTAKLLIP